MEVVGDSESDVRESAEVSSTTEIGGTYKGSEDPESEELTEFAEEVELEELDEVRTIKGT
jgi:hypothetical protein